MVKAVLFFISRFVCLGFLIIAGITLPQIWSLTKEDFNRSADGFTVYIPLEMCAPQSISVEGLSIIFDTRDTNQCHALVYLIGACAASVIFAGVAMLLFFLFDMMARCECGPITPSAVLGMSIFMALGLTQTAACCWALYQECGYREDFFMEMFDKRGAGDIAHVKTHGNRSWFLATMIVAIVAAALLLLDSIMNFLCYGRRERKTSESSVNNVGSSDAVSTSAATQKVANSDAESRPAGWTNY
jgi:hypothetical protein